MGNNWIDIGQLLIRKLKQQKQLLINTIVKWTLESKEYYTTLIKVIAKTPGYDVGMKKAVRNHKLGIKDIMRNKRISRKRSHTKRCFAVMKRAHNASRVSVITIARAGMKFMMNSIVYSLMQLKYLASIQST